MMLQVRNCKLILLAALLIGAAGSLAASGFFTINAEGDRVQFADANLQVGGKEYFQWSELSTQVPFGERVLTQAEWYYLFQTRVNAYQLYALGRIKTSTDPETYQNGLIILPDYETWVQPAGVKALDVTHTQNGYEKNTYSAAGWDSLATAGAVFLPCMGYSTDGTTGTEKATHGTYWTSTEYATGDPYYIQFDNQYFYAEKHNSEAGDVYRSVRTVKAAPAILSENDEQSEFAAKKALLKTTASTEAYIIRTLRKAGCFNTLCLPFSVSNIENSPLADAEVYTFTSATVQDGTLLLDIARVTSNSLDAGTPYLIQWDNTGEEIKVMHFTGITSSSWDSDEKADSAGTGDVKFKGFYGKTHINDDTNGDQHLNLFLAGGNELYWPNDGADENAKMLGFRAYFQVTTSGGASSPIRRGMPAALRIVENSNTTTDVDHVQRDDAQCTKVMRDGQLYLLHNGRMYNVQGQMIKEGGLQ